MITWAQFPADEGRGIRITPYSSGRAWLYFVVALLPYLGIYMVHNVDRFARHRWRHNLENNERNRRDHLCRLVQPKEGEASQRHSPRDAYQAKVLLVVPRATLTRLQLTDHGCAQLAVFPPAPQGEG